MAVLVAEYQAYKQQPQSQPHDSNSSSNSHLKEIRVRLLALRAAWLLDASTASSAARVGRTEIDLLWTLSVDGAQCADEASLFFQWIQLCLNTSTGGEDDAEDDGRPLVDLSLAEWLLLHKCASTKQRTKQRIRRRPSGW